MQRQAQVSSIMAFTFSARWLHHISEFFLENYQCFLIQALCMQETSKSTESVNPSACSIRPVWKYRKPLEVALWIPVVQIVAFEILHAKFGHRHPDAVYMKRVKAHYMEANEGASAFLFLTFVIALCVKRRPPSWIPLVLGTGFASTMAHMIGRTWVYKNEEK